MYKLNEGQDFILKRPINSTINTPQLNKTKKPKVPEQVGVKRCERTGLLKVLQCGILSKLFLLHFITIFSFSMFFNNYEYLMFCRIVCMIIVYILVFVLLILVYYTQTVGKKPISIKAYYFTVPVMFIFQYLCGQF